MHIYLSLLLIFTINTLLLAHEPKNSINREPQQCTVAHTKKNSSEFNNSWKDFFEENPALRKYKDVLILSEAHSSYVIDEIPDEPFVDIREQKHPRIYMMPNPKKPLSSPDCNSGFEDASKVRSSLFEGLIQTIKYIDELAPDFGYEPGSIDIAVYEGLRSLEVQKKLFNTKQAEIQAEKPYLTQEEIDKETALWVSPVKQNVPPHSTGCAIDVRLKMNNQFLDMGQLGAIWGTNSVAPTFSENTTCEQKKNRILLFIAASKAGLTNYKNEFWHYALKIKKKDQEVISLAKC